MFDAISSKKKTMFDAISYKCIAFKNMCVSVYSKERLNWSYHTSSKTYTRPSPPFFTNKWNNNKTYSQLFIQRFNGVTTKKKSNSVVIDD